MNRKILELKLKHKTLFGEDYCKTGNLESIESTLKIKLPSDFRDISTFYRGGLLGGHSLFTFDTQDNYSIAFRTIFYREKINLPLNFIALEETEVSCAILDTLNSNTYYISTEDLHNLCNGDELIYDPIIYKSFLEFFELLINEEEKIRAK